MSRHRTLKGALAAAVLALALTPAIGSAATRAPLTGSGEPDAIPGNYIVVMDSRASPATQDQTKRTVRALGGTIGHEYEAALAGFAATLPPAALTAVSRDPYVAYVEADASVSIASTQAPPSWGLDRIDQVDRPLDRRYTYVPDGKFVSMYVIDSGMRFSHGDFGGRAHSGPDYVDDDNDATDTCLGHGTNVASTIGGQTYGVAKGVTLFAVRVMKCNGTGDLSDVIAGVEWVTRRNSGLSVATMSISGGASRALDEAVENSIARGFTYVAAAGNDGADACDHSPGRVPGVITVSATTSSDARPIWANDGRCVDLFAPGEAIPSAWIDSNSSSLAISGTSMAAAHVAGVVATYLHTHPQSALHAAVVRAALVDNATEGKVTNVGADTPNRLLFSRLGSQIAFARPSGNVPTGLSMVGWAGAAILGRAMAPGTSPSITALSADKHQIAFQAASTELWTTGSAGTLNWQLGMMPGTSPSIAALRGGGYQVAFQANTGVLWTVSSTGQGPGSLGIRMMPGTSPSIAGLSGGGYQIAFHAADGALSTTGTSGIDTESGSQMAPGTSPSITALPGGGYEVAYQSGKVKGALMIEGTAGTGFLGLVMRPGTSPSITTLPGGGYEIAFQSHTGALSVAGSAGTGSQGLPMMAGTSPSITTLPSGRYEIAYQASSGKLSSLSMGGSTDDWGRFMTAGTSPSVAGL